MNGVVQDALVGAVIGGLIGGVGVWIITLQKRKGKKDTERGDRT